MAGALFERFFTAEASQIDELGHVNNAEWVRWIQALSTAHWDAIADPAHIAAYVWVVTRHEIDYRGNVRVGESVTGQTWIVDAPRGARFTRQFRFVDAVGKTVVEGNSTWAMLGRASGRLERVPDEVAVPFLR